MQLNPAAFNQLLTNFAEPMLWRRSFSCACINPSSGSPSAKCPVCSGKGRLWLPALQVNVAVASSSTQQQWAKMGLWQQGDLVVSIHEASPMYEISQFDRVTQLTSTNDFSLPFVHGSVTERIHGSVKAVSRLFWLDGATVVDGPLPVVNGDGTFSWPNGEPPSGKTYSLTGTRYAEYFCFGPFSNDRMKHGGARLPRKMVMRGFDLFGR